MNRWTLKEEAAYCLCDCGIEFCVDLDDYPRVSQYQWHVQKKSILTYLDRRQRITLPTFIVFGISTPRKRVLRKDCMTYDYRRSNLWYENTYVIKGDIARGQCFDGREFVVDVESLPLVSPYIWHIDKNGYVISKINGRVIKQHRLLMDVVDCRGVEVDHINWNTADNRMSNLRMATRSQNCQHRRLAKHNKSGEPGVYWAASANKWAAQINKDGVRHYLGVFDNKSDAIAARRDAAKALHGDFYG